MARSKASEAEPLGRQEIVDAAMRVTKAEGLDGLTMRALATELGVTPMAMYHHVPNKAALLQLVADAVIEQVEIPPKEAGTWDERLAALARELRDRLAEFPGVGPYLLASEIPTPGADRLVTAGISMLVEEGFGEREASLAFTAVHNYLLGRLYVEANLRGARFERLRARRKGLPEPPLAHLPSDEYFEYGLQRLLRGLRADSGSS